MNVRISLFITITVTLLICRWIAINLLEEKDPAFKMVKENFSSLKKAFNSLKNKIKNKGEKKR